MIDPDSPYFYAGYDPPFKLFFRRNEVWLPIRHSASNVENRLEEDHCTEENVDQVKTDKSD